MLSSSSFGHGSGVARDGIPGPEPADGARRYPTSNVAQVTDDLLGNDTDDHDVDDAADGSRPDETAATVAEPGPATTVTDETADAGSAVARWRERRRNRVSKWDRPPEPKDWRFFVGTLGKVLIATGILMFGFVAYQLWGTGIETARAQNALENTFEAAVAANRADDTAQVVDDTVQVVDDAEQGVDDAEQGVDDRGDAEPDDQETPTTTPVDDLDGDESVDEPEPAAGVGGGAPSDLVPGGVDLSDEAIVQNVPIVPPGEAIAKIEIPRIGIEDMYVVQGVKLDDLKKGPGHYPDTPLPGQLGNASIAGHRTTYGAPFFDVDRLQPGDEIIVTMITGDRFVYGVTGSQVVTAADSWVIGTRDPNVAELTLTTCHPKYTARDRLVIHSVLVPEKSAQVGRAEFWDAGTREVVVDAADDPGDDAEPDESADGDRPTGDDPTFDTGDDDGAGAKTRADGETDERPEAVVVDPTPDTAVDDDSASTDATPDATTDATATDETTDATATDDGTGNDDDVAVVDPDDAEIDAFSEGWFDDDEAWPQIALWGSVLTIISLLAYQLSKKTRHDSIGFMVGIFPFLVALYFFFQNVNRLLPPGL